MRGLLDDIRFAVRQLRKMPGFTVATIVILGLGIGAGTAAFSIVNVLQFRPLNGVDAGSLVQVYSRDRSQPDGYRFFSYPNYRDIRESSDAFSGLLAQDFAFVGVTEREITRRRVAMVVSSNYFSTLGVTLPRGRAFTDVDDQPGARPVVVVSHGYWQAAGADPGLVGKPVSINGLSFTVIGIAPEGFTGAMALVSPELWLPLGAADHVGRLFSGPQKLVADRANHRFMLVGRLKPGMTPASATSRLDAIGRRLEAAYPAENRHQQLLARPLMRVGVSPEPMPANPVTLAATFLLGMALLLLIITCLNVANMFVARGALRQREVAIRLAIGGSRWRVARLILVEAMVLSLAGGVAGLWLACEATRLLVSSLVGRLPALIVYDATPDLRVLLAAFAFSSFAALVFGAGPALRLSRADVTPAMKDQAGDLPTKPGRRRRFAARHTLATVQIALSLALLTAGGLFLTSLVKATTGDPGFRIDDGLVVSVDASLARFGEPRAREAFGRVLARCRSLPGVRSASLASTVPYGDAVESRGIQRAGAGAGDPHVGAIYVAVGADYFPSLGIRMVRGRGFTQAEEAGSQADRTAIVDTVLASRLWPGREAVGQRLQIAGRRTGGETPPTYEVVGVVANVRGNLFSAAESPHVYLPFGRHHVPAATIHVRLAGSGRETPAATLQTVRRELKAVEPGLPVVALGTFREHRDTSGQFWYAQAAANILALFGLAALAVSAVGVYGLRAYLVARRTREFGVRLAVGATAADVVRMVLVEGARLVTSGLAAGLLLALGIASLLSGWVYGVSTFEPAVFVAAPLVLIATMLLACFIPARRAASIDPVTALRHE